MYFACIVIGNDVQANYSFLNNNKSILFIDMQEVCVHWSTLSKNSYNMVLRKPPSKITHSSCLKSYTYKALRTTKYTHSHYIIGDKSIFNIRIEESYHSFDHIFIQGSYYLGSCYKNIHTHQPYRSHLTLTLSSHMNNIIHTSRVHDYY